jgi:hypothetical protein
MLVPIWVIKRIFHVEVELKSHWMNIVKAVWEIETVELRRFSVFTTLVPTAKEIKKLITGT